MNASFMAESTIFIVSIMECLFQVVILEGLYLDAVCWFCEPLRLHYRFSFFYIPHWWLYQSEYH